MVRDMSDAEYQIDDLDRRLIGELRRGGRLSNSDLARTLDLARGTVQSRLGRLVDTGVITGWGPDLDRRSSDLGVLAFTTLTIAQGSHDRVVASLGATDALMVHQAVPLGYVLLASRDRDRARRPARRASWGCRLARHLHW